MSIKTILVHLANDAGHRARLDAGRALARRYQAHLLLLYITSPVHMPAAAAGRAASAVYLEEAHERARERAAEIEAEMARTRIGPDMSWEFRIDGGKHIEVLTEYSHFVDLAIVGQPPEREATDLVTLHRPDDLVLTAGCPVMVMPPVAAAPDLTGPVLVAWKASKEASRAVHGALAFLATAPKVYVLPARRKGGLETPGVMIGDYLARHGADVEVLPEDDDRGEPGERIRARARELDCKLIVMGAYSRSRLSEFIFGGTTRHMLCNVDVPVLMSN
ncbi:MAG: universal stress protein [Alphaproteobacteria bacterium]